jgi:hypothetical protein
MSNVVGNVLVDQNDSDIIPRDQALEGLFDLLDFRVLVDDQKVGVFGGAVANPSQNEPRHSVLEEIDA